MTSAQRQKAFKERMAEQGLGQCNVWVPKEYMADLIRAAELMREHGNLTIARLVNVDTGILCGLKNGPKVSTPVNAGTAGASDGAA